MKIWKKSIAVVVAIMMVLMAIPALNVQAKGDHIIVTVNGEVVVFDGQQPIMVDNTVLVPVRGVFELAGFTVEWNAGNRTAVIYNDYIDVVIPADGTTFWVGKGPAITPEVPQRVVNNRLLLPLRAVAEALGGTAEWDEQVAAITFEVADEYDPGEDYDVDPDYNVDPEDHECDEDCDHEYVEDYDEDDNGYDEDDHECDDDCDHDYDYNDYDCDDDDCDDEEYYVHECDEYCDDDCEYAVEDDEEADDEE